MQLIGLEIRVKIVSYKKVPVRDVVEQRGFDPLFDDKPPSKIHSSHFLSVQKSSLRLKSSDTTGNQVLVHICNFTYNLTFQLPLTMAVGLYHNHCQTGLIKTQPNSARSGDLG